jgi:hypothetical protein
VLAREGGELQPGLHLEEGDGAVFELLADDPGRGEAEAVAVEGDGAREVVDAEGKEGDAGFHGGALGVGVDDEFCRRDVGGRRLLRLRRPGSRWGGNRSYPVYAVR